MTTFIDPRSDPKPPAELTRQPATDEADLAELVQLCKTGGLYDVERWIKSGRPLQVILGASVKRQRVRSVLEVVLECQNHALEVGALSRLPRAGRPQPTRCAAASPEHLEKRLIALFIR